MANPDRDTVYTTDGTNRSVYTRENNSTGWFVGIIVALALLAIAYLVFSANSQPSSTTINNTPAVTTPAAPVDPNAAPMTTAPAVTAPAANDATSVAPSAPATTSSAPAATTSSAAPATSSAAQ